MARKILLGGGIVALALVLTACPTNLSSEEPSPETPTVNYTVTYERNGADGGSVPVDPNRYQEGAEVTVLDNVGALTLAGFDFDGWNSTPDGSGATYAAGVVVPMPASDLTLYARWTDATSPEPTYTVFYDANGATGGSVPVDPGTYIAGALVTVLGSADLERTGFSFVGWNTASDRSGTGRVENEQFSMPADNVTLFAQWDPLPTYSVVYRENGATAGLVPSGPQVFTAGETVAVRENSNDLRRNDFVFAGWNTASDGSGTAYGPANTFTMPDASVTLDAEWWSESKLTPSDGSPDDWFGTSVSVDGNYAIVGAFLDDNTNGINAGAAYILERNGAGNWILGPKLIAADGAADDHFGWSVAISGNFAIVGAPREDQTFLTDTGAVYIFERDGAGNWDSGTKLVPTDITSNDFFGWSVAIDGTNAVVGAYQASGMQAGSGAAYIITRNFLGDWNVGPKLAPTGLGQNDEFGRSVAIDGDFTIIGAPRNDANGLDAGSAYVFRRVSTSDWGAGSRIEAADGGPDENFGFSVSISGDGVLVGAYLDDDNGNASGSAYVFRRNGTNSWSFEQKLLAPVGAAQDRFGWSVSLDGPVAVGGATRAFGSDIGSAYLFRRDAGGTWSSGVTIVSADGLTSDQFGNAVAIDGTSLIVGAWRENNNGNDSGSVSVYWLP